MDTKRQDNNELNPEKEGTGQESDQVPGLEMGEREARRDFLGMVRKRGEEAVKGQRWCGRQRRP